MEESIIKKGEVIGFETDTVWGLGCLPDDIEAVNKIYEIKNRDRTKPLILMSHDINALKKYVTGISNYAELLTDKFFPGALTLIFKRSNLCPEFICAGFDTVGIRVPDSENFTLVTKKVKGSVLATTSLNISNEPPCKDYSEAVEKFGKKVKIIKPKIKSHPQNLASTVVLCLKDEIKVLREGSIKI